MVKGEAGLCAIIFTIIQNSLAPISGRFHYWDHRNTAERVLSIYVSLFKII